MTAQTPRRHRIKKTDPATAKKDYHVRFRISGELKSQLEEYCKNHHVTRSDAARQSIKQFLDAENTKEI